MKPRHLIPQRPYDKFKGYCHKYIWMHYLLHCTFCVFKDTLISCKPYKIYTPSDWINKFGKKKRNINGRS